MARALVAVQSPPPLLPGKPGRLSDDELNRRFVRMVEVMYEETNNCPPRLRVAILNYRTYLTRLVDQDLDDDGE